MVDDIRAFPVQSGSGKAFSIIPWWLAEIAYEHYVKAFPNSAASQSLERLAKRGGFGRDELVALIRRDI